MASSKELDSHLQWCTLFKKDTILGLGDCQQNFFPEISRICFLGVENTVFKVAAPGCSYGIPWYSEETMLSAVCYSLIVAATIAIAVIIVCQINCTLHGLHFAL